MKQKTTATKVTGFLLIIIGLLGYFAVFIVSMKYDEASFNSGLFIIAFTIIIVTGAWLINDYKNDDTDTKT